ncbi:acyl-CoA thioesterase [Leptospira gomenensis]|uniref:Acyl-CoA thioesterase n=1 Tax=Leptospira gomenensis TaxID=2484974 RepID=A0A5F1YBE0_9LEPT|nr:thioesterase family protein [Leptospira gomenensis]TGK34875.1 acyl-CoA thioesterase [Leptospira gomenensis]TGK41124.1 acyl-CoA thioesterase [Leptospira gomenensis]TGK42074.1 acyl-CoA thioesterase [Leptospira gomenensis]TGK56336.1 acyl-CoA thioesterase [Leptospira gomenensis]
MAKPIRYPYSYNQKVSWGDMDAFGHVNHVVYAKYFENARADYFTDLKLWESPDRPSEGGPVITHIEVGYRKQVRYPESLAITMQVDSVSSRSFKISCTMWNDSDECVSTASGEFIWFNFATQKPMLVPESFRNLFANNKNFSINGRL